MDSHLSSRETAKAAGLTKLAPQFAIGPLEERGRTDEVACYSLECVVGNGLLEVAFQGDHRFRRTCSPRLRKGCQTSSGFSGTLSLIDDTRLLHELLPHRLVRLAFEFLPAFVRHIAQLRENAALLDHTRAIPPRHRLPHLPTAIPDHRLHSRPSPH